MPSENHRDSRLAWAAVAILILIQFLLFRQQAIRELLWSYPANHDQVNFLHLCQQVYFKMLGSGFWAGLTFALEQSPPSTFMLPIQGSLVFYLFGPQRFNVLILVFAYFALLQAVLAYTVHRLTGRWSVSFVALGLLIGTMSRFFYAGGLSDFRADSIAASLYGVTLCCFLLSDRLSDPRWSRITVLSAALLCWFRPLTVVYLAVMCLFLVPILLFRIRRPSTALWAAPLPWRFARYGLMFVALTLPIPLIGARALYAYYVVGHLFSRERDIRKLEQGVVTLGDNLNYYPRSLYDFHLGPAIVDTWLYLMVAAVLLYGLSRLRKVQTPGDPARPVSIGWGVLVAWSLVPLVILTLNQAKSPVVVSITVAPIALLATLLLHRMVMASARKFPSGLINASFAACAMVAVCAGMTLMADAEGRPDVHSANAGQVKKLMKAYDDIIAYSQNYGLKQPVFTSDRVLEYFNGTAAAVIIFERSGLNIEPRELLATNIFERRPDEVLRAASVADCALVTLDPIEKAKKSLFPFEQTAVNWQASYRELVTSRMIQIAELTMSGHTFQLFVRPRVSVEGESYGWLTSDGARIVGTARALKALPIVQLYGSTIGSNHLKGPLGTTVTVTADGGRPPVSVPSRATIHPNESYDIQIDLTGAALPDSGEVRMQLSFDRYFVPKDLGINPDPRKLVIQFPKGFKLLPAARQIAAPPLQLRLGDLYR